MSAGLICACADLGHAVDERSVRGELGIRTRCRKYAVDQERGGLCPFCEAMGHHPAHPLIRDHRQRPLPESSR